MRRLAKLTLSFSPAENPEDFRVLERTDCDHLAY